MKNLILNLSQLETEKKQVSQILQKLIYLRQDKIDVKYQERNYVAEYFQYLRKKNQNRRKGEQEIQNQKFKDSDYKLLFPNSIWQFDMTQTFKDQILKLIGNEVILVIVLMRAILSGRINQLISINPFSIEKLKSQNIQLEYCFSYEYKFINSFSPKIAFAVVPRKFPVMKDSLNPHSFNIIHQIEFISIFTIYQGKHSNFNYQQELTNYFFELQKLEFNQDLEILVEKQKQSKKYMKIGQNTDEDIIGPIEFEPALCYQRQYIFSKKLDRWLDEQEYEQYNQKLEKYEENKQFQYLIKKYSQMPSSYQLSTIISKIPNFKIIPTSEQLDTIIQQGDALIIGRSGTGKTTCALLKLFSTDILFKLRLKLDQVKNSTSLIELDQFENNFILKTVFVTASPLLACQVKRIYQKLVISIQDRINAKRKKISENLIDTQNNTQIDQNDFEKSTFQIIEVLQKNEEENNLNDDDDQNEIEDDEIENYEKEMGKFTKLNEISKYPVFLTLKKLILLIDSSLLRSYFRFSKNNQNKVSQWHNEQLGQMSLDKNQNNQIFHDDLMQQKIHQIDNREDIFVATQEVTSEIFQSLFWPQIKNIMNQREITLINFDPSLVWAEICTKIKGHEASYQSFKKYMNQGTYTEYHTSLSKQDSQILYSCFLIYEDLKQDQGYYDILDIVNHINKEIEYGQSVLENFQYLFLDEIQDVPKAVLVMLDKLTDLGLFCYGDNAQNIAKGIGYNFYEIKNLLQNQYGKNYQRLRQKINLFDLNVNFRSHNQILQLANSVIKIIEIFFPSKVDKLKKETSDIQGPKPIVIQNENPNDLISYISEFFLNENKVVEFGCNQVILVKDQESKLKLPLEFQNILVLTIYEAKGLEFDDVILYNFFTDCATPETGWKILNNLEIVSIYIKDNEYSSYRKTHEQEIIGTGINETQQQLIEIKQIKIKEIYSKEEDTFLQFSSLCQELKQLYVAITRPKRKLIIFDENTRKRKEIQNIWLKLNAVELIKSDQISNQKDNKIILKQEDSKSNWKRQGYRMFRLGNYDQAFKCFNFAGEKLMSKKSQAYFLASKASITQKNQNIYLEAAILFEEVELPLRAAQCFFSAQDYQRAFENYQKTGQKQQIAESAYFAGKYETAGEIFIEMGEARRAIDCFRKLNKWERIIAIMIQYKDQFKPDEQLAFLNNFFPKFLNDTIQDIERENYQTENQQNQNQEVEDTQSFCVENLVNQSSFVVNQDEPETNSIELENSQSFQVRNEDSFSYLEHNAEWLKGNQSNLIKSMASSIVQSETSNILLLNQSSNISIINSRQNIYIKNKALQQLIEKFQLFSEEFKSHLENQKNSKLMLSKRDDQEKEFDHMINFLYDLDNIDIDTIYLLLDLLEQFKSYKLCIYICNQFKLAGYLGRYLVSLAFEYSPLTKKIKINQQTLGNNIIRRRLLEQSFVAQIAIQNILESINPQFLQFKYEDNLNPSNFLGINYYQDLIQLGFWKSIIYQLDFKNALDLCRTFNDFTEILLLYEKIRLSRKDQLLSEEEQYDYQKYLYFKTIELNMNGKYTKFEILFQLSESYFQQKNIQNDTINQLIENAQLKKSKLTFHQQLLQIESFIISYFYLESFTLQLTISQEQLSSLLEIQIILHNRIFKESQQQQSFQDVLSFIYKISFPQNKIMENYSQFIFIKITSNLCSYFVTNNQQEYEDVVGFVDIGFENLICHISVAIQTIRKLIDKLFNKVIEINTLKQQNYIINRTLTPQFEQELIQKILPLYILKNVITRKQKKIFQSKQYTYQISLPQSIQKNQILDCIEGNKYVIQIHDILLQSNLKSQNISNNEVSNLVQESVILFKKAQMMIQNQQDGYAFIILAINLLNYCNKLHLAIFSIRALPQVNHQAYIKYIEFLECQNSNIIEDQIGCYFEFDSYFEQRQYLDEQIYHLIRLGLGILISSLEESKNSIITLPKKFKPFIKNGKQKIIEQNIFKISNQDTIVDFLYLLLRLIKKCLSQDYDFTFCGILALTFIINLPMIEAEIKQILSKILNIIHVNIENSFINILNLTKVERYQQLVIQQSNQITLKFYNCLMKVYEIKNSANEQQLDDIYENCLKSWQQIQIDTDNLKQKAIIIFNWWKNIRKLNHQINDQDTDYFQKLKLSSFYKVKLNKFIDILQNQDNNLVFKQCLQFQRKLLKEYNETSDPINFHFYNSLLEQISNMLYQLTNGKLIDKIQIKNIEMDYLIWIQNNQEQQTKNNQFIERNKVLLALKWKDLKSGVKISGRLSSYQKQFQNQQLTSIQENDEDL